MILGAAVWPEGPSPTLRRRTLHAAALWDAGTVGALVACGGLGRHPPTEAEAMRDLLLAHGVPPDAIHLEARSRNTHENVAFALPILRRLGASEIVLVTDATHAPRARLIARGLGLRARSSSPPLRGAHPGHTLRQALRELPATAVALWRLRRHG
nr:YdcF family protein [Rubellimicrobium sp. CFH 75288]